MQPKPILNSSSAAPQRLCFSAVKKPVENKGKPTENRLKPTKKIMLKLIQVASASPLAFWTAAVLNPESIRGWPLSVNLSRINSITPYGFWIFSGAWRLVLGALPCQWQNNPFFLIETWRQTLYSPVNASTIRSLKTELP
jgi:hypothetical protein